MLLCPPLLQFYFAASGGGRFNEPMWCYPPFHSILLTSLWELYTVKSLQDAQRRDCHLRETSSVENFIKNPTNLHSTYTICIHPDNVRNLHFQFLLKSVSSNAPSECSNVNKSWVNVNWNLQPIPINYQHANIADLENFGVQISCAGLENSILKRHEVYGKWKGLARVFILQWLSILARWQLWNILLYMTIATKPGKVKRVPHSSNIILQPKK